MAREPLKQARPVSLTIPQGMWQELFNHLFPGDEDEHGAVIAAGVVETDRGVRLIAHKLFLAVDGVDFVNGGARSYRALTPGFIYNAVSYCEINKLCYLAIHNHRGRDYVDFSPVDLASHVRGYPALLDIMRGAPVGALVFARNAVAGDIWFSTSDRRPLAEARILGPVLRRLYNRPPAPPADAGPEYERQVMLFGAHGQALLRAAKVGIIGVGGAGSIVNEYAAHLGVGEILSVDAKRISKSNRSRIVGSVPSDLPKDGLATSKIEIAERVARNANPKIVYCGLMDDFAFDDIAKKFRDCDFLFLAADAMRARLVFNALIHQYGIPGIQIGTKITAEKDLGTVAAAFSVARWVTPDLGCLLCNGLIPSDLLAMEAKDDAAQANQRYGTGQDNPSVITMNAVAAAHAINDFLMFYVGLADVESSIDYHRWDHRYRSYSQDGPRREHGCTECGGNDGSRWGMGDAVDLPTFCRSNLQMQPDAASGLAASGAARHLWWGARAFQSLLNFHRSLKQRFKF